MAVSFNTTDDRLEKIDSLVERDVFSHRSAFLNAAIDLLLKDLHIKRVISFLYFVTIPVFLFLLCVGFTLYFQDWFFYLLTIVSGVYVIVFSYFYYDKYREVKRHTNNSK